MSSSGFRCKLVVVTLSSALVAAGLSGLWGQAGAPAEPAIEAAPTIRWTWETRAPPDCLDADAVAREVEARLQAPIFEERAGAWDLRARFEQLPEGRAVRLALIGPAGQELGTRELVSPGSDCTELRVLLPVVIAVLLNPHVSHPASGSPEVVPQRQREAVLETTPEVRSRDTLEGTSETRAHERPGIRCAIGPVLLAGFAPGLLSPAASLGCALSRGPVGLDLDLSYRLPITGDGMPSLTITGVAGRAGLCWGFDFPGVQAGPCGGAGVSRVEARGEGFESTQDVRWVPELWVWGRLDWDVGRIAFVRFLIGGTRPLLRPVYVYETAAGDPKKLYQPSALFGVAQIAAGLRFE